MGCTFIGPDITRQHLEDSLMKTLLGLAAVMSMSTGMLAMIRSILPMKQAFDVIALFLPYVVINLQKVLRDAILSIGTIGKHLGRSSLSFPVAQVTYLRVPNRH